MHGPDCRAATDVPVTGVGAARDDAESGKAALLHHRQRRTHRGLESGDITDDMIGRQNEQNRIRVRLWRAFECSVRGERDGGGGVSAQGLEKNCARA